MLLKTGNTFANYDKFKCKFQEYQYEKYELLHNNNNNNNNNVSISTMQNKLSSGALTAVQTNMSLVFRQKSAEKRTQSEC